ncbi:hypothetical protein [Henriciella litoralis]|uniref:hypothetical protein n=1 Tax=Henriciella litoralis TaxID=568102 RepID=UPI000A05FCDF|nr:hypothetical protein [Henriciella litoralis]
MSVPEKPDKGPIFRSPAAELPTIEKQMKPGWNDMAEDIFGLSVRGLVTMRDLVIRPSLVFDAARWPDWLQRYTPSIRLVSSLVALMLLLRIFWAGEDSAMYQSVLEQIERAAPNISADGGSRALAENYFAAWAIVFPLAYLAIQFLMAMCVRIWGKDVPLVTRVRLYFAAIVPGVILANLSLVATPLIGPAQLTLFTALYLVVCGLAYGATAYLGLKSSYASPFSRLWRGALFAVIVLFADTVASFSSSILGGIVAGQFHLATG